MGTKQISGFYGASPLEGPVSPTPTAAKISAQYATASASGSVTETVAEIAVVPTGLSAHESISTVELNSSGDTATVDLSSHFSFPGVEGTIVEFDTVLGKFAAELYPNDAPINVANFLQHVVTDAYSNTFIHRSVPNFVIQGGGYYTEFNLPAVERLGTASLEYSKPNFRGTLAMARSSDPDSAGSQWFINTVDNSETLKPLGEGREGYTVIGRLLGGGLQVADRLAALPTVAISELFSELPVYNYVEGNALVFDNLVTVRGVAEVSLYPTSDGTDALMTFTATSSSEAVVRTSLSGSALTLTSIGLGSANITVRATESAGDWVEHQFTVNVTAVPSIVRQPISRTFVRGTNGLLDVEVSGSEPFGFQWMKDGEPIPLLGIFAGSQTDTLSAYDISEDSLGSFTVRVTNSAGSVVSDAAEMTIVDQLATQSTRGNGYSPSGIAYIDSHIIFSGAPTSIKWSVLLPDGWTYRASGGAETTSGPSEGDSGLIEFSWSSPSTSQLGFWYFLNVPADATGDASFVGMVTISREEDTEVLADPDPLLIPLAVHHSADIDGDFKLGLSELLRVIELYNTRLGSTRTGAYIAVNGTVDDFLSDGSRASSTSITLLRYHSADSDRDAQLSLSELLRVIELYNTRSGSVRTGKYRKGEGTIDGFSGDP